MLCISLTRAYEVLVFQTESNSSSLSVESGAGSRSSERAMGAFQPHVSTGPSHPCG